MKINESLTTFAGGESSIGFNIRTYDSAVEFQHRALFEHKHSDFEISLILQGEGRYHFKEGSARIKKGDIFLLGSNQMHCITDVYGEEQMVLFNIQMEAGLFWSSSPHLLNESHLRLLNGRCTHLQGHLPVAAEMAAHIQSVRREATRRQAGYQIRIYAALLSVIGLLVRELSGELEAGGEFTKQNYLCMERAVEYINAHLAAPLTLEEVAAHAGYSRNYFSSLFTSLNGLSLWDYITIKRIALGRSLLLSADLPITEVAARSGYQNLSNFNRHFKKLCGCSPREYAARHRAQ